MVKSRVLAKPKGGRPATGRDPVRAVRLSDEFLAKVDTWAAGQADKPGRSEAIRRLVALGLEVLPPAPKRTKKKAAAKAKASELAGAMIDWLADKSYASGEGRLARLIIRGKS